MRMQAIWMGAILADSDSTIVLDGNHYFPIESINEGYFRSSDRTSKCYWKGTASYYDIQIGDEINAAAAWYYPNPSQAAQEIKDRIAFWRGVKVVEVP